MAFWDAYRASLKSRDVEEPIDYWLHRPLGYIVARLSEPTPLTPNLITIGSILLGWAAAACLLVDFPHHYAVGGLLIFASTVFDCADGQLARMRKTSSVWGRMLDGSADTLVTLAIVPATIWRIWQRTSHLDWFAHFGLVAAVLAVISVITSGWQILIYDYYKNLWSRFTSSGYHEGESYEAALARQKADWPRMNWYQRLASHVYVFQAYSVQDILRRFDPYTSFDRVPAWSPETEAIYRRHQTRPWAICRAYCGVGTLMFGLALFNGIDLPEVYLVLRLVLFHPFTWFVLAPMQRRASQDTFAELDALAARRAPGAVAATP